MSLPVPIASFKTTITNAISGTATTIPIDSVTDDDGTSMNGKVIGCTIDKGTSSEEYIIGTVDAANSQLTSVTRGVSVLDGLTSVTALKKAHRVKAPIEITAHPYLARAIRVLNGDEAMDASNRIILDSDTDATDDKELVTQGQLNRTAMGAVTTSIVLVAGTAGETVAAGDLIYFDSVTNNEWMLADADTAAKAENVLLGIAQGAGTDGNAISGGVLLFGVDANQTGMTIGDVMYASDTAGAIASSAGTKEVTAGIAKSATELYFMPRFNQMITEDQQDLLDAITANATELNQLDGATITAAQLTEAGTFFGATDMTGAEAEQLTDGSNADDLHVHEGGAILAAFREKYKYGSVSLTNNDDFSAGFFTKTENGTGTVTESRSVFRLYAGGSNGDDGIIKGGTFAKVAGGALAFSDTSYLLFEAPIDITGNTNCRYSFGFADGLTEVRTNSDTQVGAWFAVNESGELYACQAGGSTNENTQITGITLANVNVYRIEVDQANNTTKFYVNGTLKATLSDSNDMPDSGATLEPHVAASAIGAATGYLFVHVPANWHVG